MTELTAAASVELWLSDGSSPLDMKKILILDYDDLVRVYLQFVTRMLFFVLVQKNSQKPLGCVPIALCTIDFGLRIHFFGPRGGHYRQVSLYVYVYNQHVPDCVLCV